MDPFNNDPFEDIIREFFGQGKPQRITESERDERIIDFIEYSDYVYIVLEIPGYDEEDVDINIQDNKLNVITKKKNLERVQTYLQRKLSHGIKVSKTLPQIVKKKKYEYKVNNGILEIKFKKK